MQVLYLRYSGNWDILSLMREKEVASICKADTELWSRRDTPLLG